MDADHDTEQIIADWHRTLMGEVTALEVLDAIKTRRRSGVPGEDAALVSALHRQLVLAATELMLEAEAVMDEMIGHLPDDVRAAISQIDQHYRRQATAEKAPEAGEEVLAGAKGTGFSRRDVLEMRGRPRPRPARRAQRGARDARQTAEAGPPRCPARAGFRRGNGPDRGNLRLA